MSPDELAHTCQGKQDLGRAKQRNVATSRLKTQSHGELLGLCCGEHHCCPEQAAAHCQQPFHRSTMSPGTASSLLAPLLSSSICTRTSVPLLLHASMGDSQPCSPAAAILWAPLCTTHCLAAAAKSFSQEERTGELSEHAMPGCACPGTDRGCAAVS